MAEHPDIVVWVTPRAVALSKLYWAGMGRPPIRAGWPEWYSIGPDGEYTGDYSLYNPLHFPLVGALECGGKIFDYAIFLAEGGWYVPVRLLPPVELFGLKDDGNIMLLGIYPNSGPARYDAPMRNSLDAIIQDTLQDPIMRQAMEKTHGQD